MIKIIQDAGTKIKDLRSRHYLKKQVNKKHLNEKINVGFLVQDLKIWDKYEGLYKRLKTDDRFQPVIVLVPQLKNDEYNYENNIDLFEDDDKVIRLMDDSHNFISVKELKLDYLFYSKPYDHYLPECIRSTNMVKYTKCCYIPYGGSVFATDLAIKSAYTAKFCRNIYLVITDEQFVVDDLEKRFNKNVKKGNQHFEKMAQPFQEMYSHLKEEDTQKDTVVWAPRWTLNLAQGGTNFFNYKDRIVEYKQQHSEVNMIVRPHPMLFDNLIEIGKMSKEEVQSYKEILNKNNIELSTTTDIEGLFKKSYVYISDRSSMIDSFFMTGKPIVYCSVDGEDDYPKHPMMDGIYRAHKWDDIENTLEEILSGNDRLKAKREEILEKYYRDVNKANDKIMEYIYKDYT